jgi:UDP-N-acetylglucosamine acyltransferase
VAIHPTAIVDPGAEIADDVEIGAYAIVEAGVTIGSATRLWPHTFVGQGTTLGKRVQVHPFATVGHHPQDFGWDGAPSYTVVGDDTQIREHVSIHRGTKPETTTRIGQRCMLMATAHVAHNCTVGDDVVLANAALLAGYVSVGDRSFLGGGVGVHQFCRIGRLVMCRGHVEVFADVPPFTLVAPAGVVGLNVVGLRRAKLTADERHDLRRLYKRVYRSGMAMPEALTEARAAATTDRGREFLAFFDGESKRHYQRFYGTSRSGHDESAT